jgi:ABC-type multidrug transport system ATPase subunit
MSVTRYLRSCDYDKWADLELSARRVRGSLGDMHIRADGLTKKFGGVTVLDGLSWDIEPGQIVAVLGPNGAGKTTLLNALSGCIMLDSGQVFMDGQPFTPDRGDLRRRFAFLPNIPPVPPGWSPLRFIGTVLKLYGTNGERLEERVLQLLEKLDLLGVAQWKFRQLSRGQSHKAVLAAFLAADPEVWLVDEPFASGMDPRGLNCFKEYAREAASRGRTIIYTTRIIEVAEQFARRICVLDKGRVKACEEPARLHEAPAFAELLANLREHTEL